MYLNFPVKHTIFAAPGLKRQRPTQGIIQVGASQYLGDDVHKARNIIPCCIHVYTV